VDQILGRGFPEHVRKHVDDLTERALARKLDPPQGHRTEIDQALRVLMRQTRNCPLLMGGSGIGKSKLFEDIAEQIHYAGAAPPLEGYRLLSVDLAGLCAEVRDQKAMEEALEGLTMAAVSAPQPVILMLDDLDRALDRDLPVMLWLQNRKLRCVGAITPEKHARCLARNPDLERYFQPISIQEPSVQETVEMLRRHRDRGEAHHHVMITDQGLEAAAVLAKRHLQGRALPARAIELLDDAAIESRMAALAHPPDLKEINAQIEHLLPEREAAIAEQDFEKAAHLRDQADNLQKKKETITREWHKKARDLRAIDAQIEQLNQEKMAAVGEQDLEKAAHLRDQAGNLQKKKEPITREWHELKEIYAQIEQLFQEKMVALTERDFEKAAHLRDQADKLEKKKEPIAREWREKAKERDSTVDEYVVASTVSRLTGIPADRLLDSLTQPEPASAPAPAPAPAAPATQAQAVPPSSVSGGQGAPSRRWWQFWK
jgi:ATP-dependent Clp protease ATP-binding subunit ClpC